MAEFNGKKVLLAGLKGEKGDPGPQGPQGEKGDPGTLEGASSVTLEGNSGSKVLVSAEEALPYIVAEAGTDAGKQVLVSLHPATPLAESITLTAPGEGGTLATREWVSANVGTTNTSDLKVLSEYGDGPDASILAYAGELGHATIVAKSYDTVAKVAAEAEMCKNSVRLEAVDEPVAYVVYDWDSDGNKGSLSLTPAEAAAGDNTLLLPNEDGTLATQEWTKNVFTSSYPEFKSFIWIKPTIASDTGYAKLASGFLEIKTYRNDYLEIRPEYITLNYPKKLYWPGEVDRNGNLEEATIATREWSQENVARKVLEPGWGDGEALPQSKVSNMPSWPTAAVAVSVLVTRMGLGAFVPQDGKRYECLFSIGGTLYLTSLLVSGENATFDTGNREALKPGDIVTMNGVTMMVKAGVPDSAKNIWDVLVPLRGRFPVMPLTSNNSLTIQDMRDCDMKVYFSGTSRSAINIFSARNCSLLIDTKDYAETTTGGGKTSCQTRIYGDNATLVQGATPVLRNSLGQTPSVRSVVTQAVGGFELCLDYINYDQNGVVGPNSDGIMCNNMWLVTSNSEWTYSDTDGTKKDLRLNIRYEFAESGQPRMDVIPYIVPHVETQSVSVMSASPEQPEDVQAPSVPSGRRGCFTLDEQRAFRLGLMNERAGADGVLRCEHCGKPIAKASDCIAHHVEELSPRNLNDREVSLNPGNIRLVHSSCHNEIHDRWGGRLQLWQRKAYVVFAPPFGSARAIVEAGKGQGDLVVDTDGLWATLGLLDGLERPASLKAVVFPVRDLLLDKVATRAGSWQRAWVTSAEPYPGERARMLERLGGEPIYSDDTREECLQRLHQDQRGADLQLYEGLISRWFDERERELREDG